MLGAVAFLAVISTETYIPVGMLDNPVLLCYCLQMVYRVTKHHLGTKWYMWHVHVTLCSYHLTDPKLITCYAMNVNYIQDVERILCLHYHANLQLNAGVSDIFSVSCLCCYF